MNPTTGPTLSQRMRAVLISHRSLLTNAGSMVGASLVTSLLGVGFWLVAAQQFNQAAVGVAAAAVSAMVLLGFIGTLGLGTLLMGELPRRDGEHRSLLNAALLISALVGSLLGLGFALVAPLVSANLSALGASWLAALSFALGASLTSLTFVLDQSLIGMLRGGLQLGRNIVFASVKLLALIVIAALLVDAGAPWIYTAWGFGIAVSLIVLVRFYTRRGGDPLRPNFALLGNMRASAASHATVNLALETADLAMPVIVLTLLSAAANASFYIAWLIAGFLVVIPLSLSSVAYALGSGDATRIAERFRFTLGLSLALGAIANLLLVPGASPLLGLFGDEYARQATGALHLLALGVFPLAFKTHYVAIRRVQRRLRSALPLVWGGTLLELGGGALGGALGGISGVAWGWLAGCCVEALLMGPQVLRALRPEQSAGLAGDDAEVGTPRLGRLAVGPDRHSDDTVDPGA